MTGNLEYLMSSLPHLSFEDAEGARTRVFHVLGKYAGSDSSTKDLIVILEEEAEKFLAFNDAMLFRNITLKGIYQKNPEEWSHSILEAFAGFMRQQKQEVKRLREARRDEATARQRKDLILPLSPGDALDEEMFLLKRQWEKLEELSFGRYADFGALIIYKLKLEVLKRCWSFDQEKGLETFVSITQTTEYGG